MQEEYNRLKERYLRTTNALASAAHDLKTPLSILNGYVELLHSEKLGRSTLGNAKFFTTCVRAATVWSISSRTFSPTVFWKPAGRLHFETQDFNLCLAGGLPPLVSAVSGYGLALYFLPQDRS